MRTTGTRMYRYRTKIVKGEILVYYNILGEITYLYLNNVFVTGQKLLLKIQFHI